MELRNLGDTEPVFFFFSSKTVSGIAAAEVISVVFHLN